jgi:hypothetical protein
MQQARLFDNGCLMANIEPTIRAMQASATGAEFIHCVLLRELLRCFHGL